MKKEFYYTEEQERELRREMYYYNIDEKIEKRILWIMENYKYIINKLLEDGMDNNSTG